jgi:hypothetical protein
VINGIQRNQSRIKLTSLKRSIEALYSEDFDLSRQIQVPNWKIIWLHNLKLDLLLN